jgi:hypothetical protein
VAASAGDKAPHFPKRGKHQARIKDSGVEGDGVWVDIEVLSEDGEVLSMERSWVGMESLEDPDLIQVKTVMEQAIKKHHLSGCCALLKGMTHGSRL